MSNPALQCKGVSKYFFKKRFPGSKGNVQKNPVTVAVADINLEVASQETLGVVGPNGSGKSTLMRLISTLLYPDSETIFVFGQTVRYLFRLGLDVEVCWGPWRSGTFKEPHKCL